MWVDLILFFYLVAHLAKFPEPVKRLRQTIPDPQGKPVIWIHGVSVGEIKAAAPLFRALKEETPEAFFLITTTTATGQAEAKRSLADADAIRYLPLDFSWVVRRWARRLRPHLLLVESDLWPNLLAAVKRYEGSAALVSGKISERSAKRFRLIPRLLRNLDLLLVQNQIHYDRFLPLVDPSRLAISGNLKLDQEPQTLATPEWATQIALPAITLASTHAPEEEEILDALRDLPLFIFLAPRHPERFAPVADLLTRKGIPFTRLSSPNPHHVRVMLVDAMGQLPLCYTLSRLAIVGGSFLPTIGGHNIYEPCLYHIPVLFGPHMHSQTELVARVLEAGAGRQVTLSELPTVVFDLLENPSMQNAASALVNASRGATERTLSLLRMRLFDKKIRNK